MILQTNWDADVPGVGRAFWFFVPVAVAGFLMVSYSWWGSKYISQSIVPMANKTFSKYFKGVK